MLLFLDLVSGVSMTLIKHVTDKEYFKVKRSPGMGPELAIVICTALVSHLFE